MNSMNSPELELYYAWAEEAHQMRLEASWHEGLWLLRFSTEGGAL